MQKHNRLISLLATSVLSLAAAFSNCVFANEDAVPQIISFKDVLRNNEIDIGAGAAFFEDSKGYLWIGGGNALFRFDGYEFQQNDILLDSNTGQTQRINFAVDILEDQNSNLWIASRSGLFFYDRSKGVVLPLPDDPSQPYLVSRTNFFEVDQLPSGEILGASLNGLFIIEPTTKKYTIFLPNEKEPQSIHSEIIRAIHIESPSKIWLGTDAGLELFNWNNKTFNLHSISPDFPDSPAHKRVTSIAVDEQMQFWLGTSNGLVKYSPVTKHRKRYINDPDDKASLGGNDVWRVIRDSKGLIWVASDGGGLSVYDKNNDRFIIHTYEPGREDSLTSEKLRTVYEDKSGDIWVGGSPVGIDFFDRSSSAFETYSQDLANPNSLSHNLVLAVAEDAQGDLWLGTDGGGLNYFNRHTGEFTHYKHSAKNPTSLSSNSALTVFIDSKDDVWIGTWGGGFNHFDRQSQSFTRIPFDLEREHSASISHSSRLNSAHVWHINEDDQGFLWISTFSGGLSKYDRETKTFTHYTHNPKDPDSIINNMVWSTLTDSQGNFWVATVGGLCLMNKTIETFECYNHIPDDPSSLSNSMILSVYEDSKQRLWVGTGDGLNLFDRKTKSFTAFSEEDGFINDYIKTVLGDGNGLIWVSTNNGFASFDPETKTIKNYNRVSGRLAGDFAMHSGVVSQQGEIIFGGTKGLRIIRPDSIKPNDKVPQIALTGLKIFSEPVTAGDETGILSSTIDTTTEITLSYKQSMFEIAFSALNFRSPEKNQYAYMLEGFDSQWLNAGTQRTAKYTNLSPGRYTFKVKGSNNDGLWNDDGRTLTVVQLPPPWRTWWAYTLYTLAIAGAIFWAIYHQIRKRRIIEEQNKALEQKVQERTAEVVEKSKNIQSMLSNIPQGIFVIMSNGCIHKDYSDHLETILEHQDINGKTVDEAILKYSELDSNTYDTISNTLLAVLGEDELNYEFNGSLLPNELTLTVNGATKYVDLTWSPILDDDTVDKLMVSMRDVTSLKAAEKEALKQKEQLTIIGQLLNVESRKFLAFEESSKKYIEDNSAAINNVKSDEEITQTIAMLFRNMHTVKGNCRTYGFTKLSSIVHDVESVYSEIRNGDLSLWKKDTLLNDLESVSRGLSEYSHVYHEVLEKRRSGNSADRGLGFWMPETTWASITSLVSTKTYDKLDQYLLSVNAASLDKTLEDIVSSLPSMAIQLDKKSPHVVIPQNPYLILDGSKKLLTDVFSHLLRNCVDHGLETAADRLAANKPEVGTITISPTHDDNYLHIAVGDDGRGLNIGYLTKKGIELGRWSEDAIPSPQEIAQTIFLSGVSTKQTVSDISGRGVGMDAVKMFLQENGGDISIRLLADTPTKEGYIPFELVLSLPAQHYTQLVDVN